MRILRYQEGGAIPADQAAPQEGAPVEAGAQEQGAEEQIIQLAQQIIQQMGPDAAAMLAQAIMEMLQNAQGAVGAAPEEQQFMRKGGKIVKKACRGSKVKKGCGGFRIR